MIATVVTVLFGIALMLPVGAVAADLKYAGSVTVLEGIMKDAAPLFEKRAGTKIALGGGGSSAGVKAALTGTVDIGGVSRDLKEEELKQGLVPYTIAWGAVGLVANKNIPVDNLTTKQAKEILTGKITNWKDVGGPNEPIRVLVSTPGCACREEFQELVMDKEPYVGVAVISPMKTLSETVKNTPGSVGPLATAVIEKDKVKIITIDGVGPTPENVKNKKYKASRQVNLVTKGPASGKAKEFIDFMFSAEGQSLVERNGFVRVK